MVETKKRHHPALDHIESARRGLNHPVNKAALYDKLAVLEVDIARSRIASRLALAVEGGRNMRVIAELDSQLRIAEQLVIDRDNLVTSKKSSDADYAHASDSLALHVLSPLLEHIGTEATYQKLSELLSS